MSTTLTPNLMTENVNHSVDFYCDQLGFSFVVGVAFDSETPVTEKSSQTNLQWAMVQRESASVMFQARDSFAREYPSMQQASIGASATLYLEVDELDALLARLAAGVEVVLPDHTTFYGMREQWIRDNNEYILVLAQRLRDAR